MKLWRAALSLFVSWIRLCMSLFLRTKRISRTLADAQGKSVESIKALIASLHEFNPMMGHRGCRLAVTYPEIAVMQTKAVIRAAINVQKAHPEWKIVSGDHDSAGWRSKGTEVC